MFVKWGLGLDVEGTRPVGAARGVQNISARSPCVPVRRKERRSS
jgi:hypothetical protein